MPLRALMACYERPVRRRTVAPIRGTHGGRPLDAQQFLRPSVDVITQ